MVGQSKFTICDLEEFYSVLRENLGYFNTKKKLKKQLIALDLLYEKIMYEKKLMNKRNL